MLKPAATQAARFRGLNTVSDPLRLGLEWLTRADNVNITDKGAIERREGSAATPLISGSIGSAYTTIDHQRLYFTDGQALKDADGRTLATLAGTGAISWAEVNEQVFFTNGVDAGIILADGTVLPWKWDVPHEPTLAAVTGSLPAGLYRVLCTYVLPDGRETGAGDAAEIELLDGQALQISNIPQSAQATWRTRTYIAPANSAVFGLASGVATGAMVWDSSPDYLGMDLKTDGLDPLPDGVDAIQFWNGRMWAAIYDPASGITSVFPSEPLGFHLFNLEAFEAYSGRVLMMAPTPTELVIGTDKEIWARGADGTIARLARYGVVPGQPWAFEDEQASSIVFWSTRGACRAMPFANLTQAHVSVAPGVQVGAAVISANGQRRFVAALHQGGTPFNTRNS